MGAPDVRKAEEDPTLFIFPSPVFYPFLPPTGFLLPEASWRHLPEYFSRRGKSQTTQLRGADGWRKRQGRPGEGCKTDQGGWVRGEGWGERGAGSPQARELAALPPGVLGVPGPLQTGYQPPGVCPGIRSQ